jgi:hypothetical protein
MIGVLILVAVLKIVQDLGVAFAIIYGILETGGVAERARLLRIVL